MPNPDLSPSAFRSALSKGQGRALQAVRQLGRLVNDDTVMDACLHNRAHDPQVEGSRADWMMEILKAASAVDRFRDPILSTLKQADSTSDAWDLNQLCDLAVFYARRGAAEARHYLYQIFRDQPDSTAPWMAVKQIIRLDGLDGFLYIAKERGKKLRVEGAEAEWDTEMAVSEATELLGATQIDSAIGAAAERDPDFQAFRYWLNAYRRSIDSLSSQTQSHDERMRAIPVQSVIDQIQQSDPQKNRMWFGSWGRYASDRDLEKILGVMFNEQHAGKLFKYLRIFARRPLPRFDERFIELVRHSDPDVQRCALVALGMNSYPPVRALALSRLGEGHFDRETIELLTRNFRSGDHRLIERHLAPLNDDNECHQVVGALIDVFANNKDKNCLASMRFAYEESPCSGCRERAVSLLIDLKILPDTLFEECQFDSNKETRRLVGVDA